ncbi:MAG: hypothetical protein QFX35_02275 [Candidatus Verstraetearchaeota archaeon]|nr:hypothetical protein [Candidatus Verstraetearchaeota archaeon]
MTIFLLNFAYAKDKDGITRALTPDLSDVIAILEASGALRRRWTSALKVFREEGRRTDFIFRIYYPLYLVRCEGHIIPVDGLGMNQTYLYEDSLSEEGLVSKMYVLPILGTDLCPWLRTWNENSSSVEGVRNGIALPPAVSKEDAQKIALRIKNILDSNRGVIGLLEKELASLNDRHNKVQLELAEEYRSILEDFDKKISLKNLEIEGIETYKERAVAKELKMNFAKRREELRQEREVLERKAADLRTKVNELEAEKEKILSQKKSISKRIDRLREAIEKNKVEVLEAGDLPSKVNESVRSREKHSRELWKLSNGLEGCVKRFNEISTEIGRLRDEANRTDEEIKTILEKERLLPAKEEDELNNLHKCFTGRREALVRQLLNLSEEKERGLIEIRAQEANERLKFERERQYLEFILCKVKSDCWNIESFMLNDEGESKEEVSLLQIPFYLFSTEGKFDAVEPQIFFSEKGKVESVRATSLVRNGLRYIEGNWELLSTMLFKARETFDLLSPENRNRIITAAECLRTMRVINDFQLSYVRAVGAK